MFPFNPARVRIRSITAGPRRIAGGPIQIKEGEGLKRFLLDFSQEEMRQARELWRKYAARKDLIDFSGQQGGSTPIKNPLITELETFRFITALNEQRGSKTLPAFSYDPNALAYYVDTSRGRRAIRDESIKLDVNRFVAGVQQEARAVMADLIAGKIDPQTWYDETARLAKLSYRATADIARGDPPDQTMDSDEENHWLEIAILLLLLLNNTAAQIQAGNMPASGIALGQAGGLIGAANGLFENWHLWEAGVMGKFTEARRVLGPNESHCKDSHDRRGCIELAKLGWMPIEKMTPINGATCRNHCKCRLVFR